MKTYEQGGISFIAGSWPPDADKYTLIFIHGAGLTGMSWAGQADSLKDIANTIAPDLPGHGRSTGAARDNISAYSRIISEFADRAGLRSPVPVGLSMGGAVALQLLLDFSDQFPAAILINTGAKLKVLPAIMQTIENNFQYFKDNLKDMLFSPGMDKETMAPLLEDLARAEQSAVLGDFHACDIFDIRDRLAEITQPVLIISSENDRMTPLRYGEYLEDKIINAGRIVIPDSGHMSPLEKPAEVNRAIREFVLSL